MPSPDQEPDDFATNGMFIGRVVDVDDPKGIGRVRIDIPGRIDSSAWARPLGTLLGFTPQRGAYFVPNVGADVAVWFHLGDIDSPYYLAGAPGANVGGNGEEIPTFVKDQPVADRPKLRVIETDFFVIAIDDRPVATVDDVGTPDLEANQTDPRQRLIIQFKGTEGTPSDPDENMIEIDGATRAISIQGVAGVKISTLGVLELEGGQIQFKSQGVTRRVASIGKDI